MRARAHGCTALPRFRPFRMLTWTTGALINRPPLRVVGICPSRTLIRSLPVYTDITAQIGRYVYSRSGVNVLAGPRDPMMCDTRASYATRNGKACRVRGKIRIDRIVNPDPLCGFASRCTEMTLFANALEHPPSLDIAARFITMYCFYATERCKIDTKSIPWCLNIVFGI